MLKRILLLVLFLALLGCASTNSKSTSSQDIPPNSPFAKLEIGMGRTQVLDLIGWPNDFEYVKTHKNLNPFYFGSDLLHEVSYYKGEGRLVYNNDNRLIAIQYDPTEDGYK